MKVREARSKRLLTIATDGAGILGRGGEGGVFRVREDPSLAAKIYHDPTVLRERKLQAMLAAPPADSQRGRGKHIAIAWPLDILQSTDGRFVGFTMSSVDGVPVADCCNPAARREARPDFTYRHQYRAARNIAAAFHSLHASGYVVGDVNESNIRISDTALVTLIDTDSFQVGDGNRTYRCPVGKPEFTPPELHRVGLDFKALDRTSEHDLFGLGVLIFQLLMEGAHPFASVVKGTGEPPEFSVRIARGWFPYGTRSVPCAPGRLTLPFETIDPNVRSLLVRCFDDGYLDPRARPSAAAWHEELAQAEARLQTCPANARHYFPGHLRKCPWCERAALLGGRDPFPPSRPIRQQPLRPARSGRWMARVRSAAWAVATLLLRLVARRLARLAKPAIVVAIVLLALWAVTSWIRDMPKKRDSGWRIDTVRTKRDARPSTSGLALPFEDHGACPGEGCMYGEWVVQKPVVVYTDRKAGAAIAFKLREHDVVKVPTGVVVTSKAGSARTTAAVVVGGTSVPPGTDVALLTYGGEGCYRIGVHAGDRWTISSGERGRGAERLHVCDLEAIRAPQFTWWVKVESARGGVGWTDAVDAFSPNDALLVSVIEDTSVPMQRKLSQIDAMLRDGASLNGPSGKYTDSPGVAAINSKDPALLRALLDRGLDVGRPDDCLAYTAFQQILSKNGIEVVEILLDHGLPTSCLNTPVFDSLTMGCDTATYSIDIAVEAGQLLLARGFDLRAKDRAGKTFADRIRTNRSANCRRRLLEVAARLDDVAAAPRAAEDLLCGSEKPAMSIDASPAEPMPTLASARGATFVAGSQSPESATVADFVLAMPRRPLSSYTLLCASSRAALDRLTPTGRPLKVRPARATELLVQRSVSQPRFSMPNPRA